MKDALVLIGAVAFLVLASWWFTPVTHQPAAAPPGPEISTGNTVPPESVERWNRMYPDDPINEQTTVPELIDRERRKAGSSGQP